MKTEIYFLTIVIVILVGVGVFSFVKPNELINPATQTGNEKEKTDGYSTTQTPLQQGSSGLESLSNLQQQSPNALGAQSQQSQQRQQNTMQQQTQPQNPPPPMTINKEASYSATLKTTKGTIVIELNAKATPITVNNFVSLARKKFYDGTIFHRVISGFMIQGGDPTGTGAGGPGYKFDDEPFEGEYTRGTIAMANAGPNTNGSQFFIMHKDAALPKNYVIFGKVTEGIEVVDSIAEAEVTTSSSGEKSRPVEPVKIESVEITEQ